MLLFFFRVQNFLKPEGPEFPGGSRKFPCPSGACGGLVRNCKNKSVGFPLQFISDTSTHIIKTHRLKGKIFQIPNVKLGLSVVILLWFHLYKDYVWRLCCSCDDPEQTSGPLFWCSHSLSSAFWTLLRTQRVLDASWCSNRGPERILDPEWRPVPILVQFSGPP